MPTTVLARKYRPPSFEAMVGQEHVVRALVNALGRERLHHAYLFTGTRGVGKTTVARILAKSLNCIGPDGAGGITARPCGVCQPCRDIDADRFVDYVELDAASNRGIDHILTLLEQAVYLPVVGRFKVYLIDEVHMLTRESFNALLKTLEEPPAYLKFVLATTDPQKVPPTVLSRCLQFNLRPMAPETIVRHLADVLQRESIAAEADALALIARAARGSMRDALSLADQAIAYAGGEVRAEPVRQMLGTVDRDHVYALLDAIAAGDGGALVDAVERLRELGLAATGALEETATVLQELAVAQAAPDAVDADAPDAAALARLAAALSPEVVQLLYGIVLRGRADLALAPDEHGGLVMVLLRALVFAPHGVATANDAPPTPTTRRPHPNPLPQAAEGVKNPLPLAGEGRVRVDAIEGAAAADRWNDVVRRMVDAGRVAALVRELAMQAECLRIERRGDVECWTLRVERDNLRAPACREKLEAALTATLEHAARIELEAGVAGDSPALRDAAERERRQAEAEQTIREDPLVRALMAQYKTARIVPGSIKAL